MQIGEYNEDTVRAYRFDEDRKHIFVKLWLNAEDSEPDKFSKGGCLSISGSRAAADLSTMKHCGPTRPAESQALQLKQVSPWESRTLKPENYWRKHKTADKLCTALCRPGWSKKHLFGEPCLPKVVPPHGNENLSGKGQIHGHPPPKHPGVWGAEGTDFTEFMIANKHQTGTTKVQESVFLRNELIPFN